jgi:hypothetical protein
LSVGTSGSFGGWILGEAKHIETVRRSICIYIYILYINIIYIYSCYIYIYHLMNPDGTQDHWDAQDKRGSNLAMRNAARPGSRWFPFPLVAAAAVPWCQWDWAMICLFKWVLSSMKWGLC